MNIITIIPARGGSIGILKKNIRIVGGLPLIVHSIRHSINAKMVDRTIVSTDDDEISKISKNNGAEVIKRPAEIRGDKAPSEQALKHVINTLKNENYKVDIVVFLQPTSPIRRPNQIDNAIKLMLKDDSDSCFSACVEHFTGRWKKNKNGYAKPINYQLSNRPMRQDYPEYYLENGNICIFKTHILEKTGNRLGGKITIFPMDNIESLQIDKEQDLILIDTLINNIQNS